MKVFRLFEDQKNLIAAPYSGIRFRYVAGQIVDPNVISEYETREGKPHSDCAIRCIAGGIQPLSLFE